jgi:hypothetical protein
MTRSRSLILSSFALVRARNNQELWKTLTSPVRCRVRPDGVGFVAREEGAIDLHTKWAPGSQSRQVSDCGKTTTMLSYFRALRSIGIDQLA